MQRLKIVCPEKGIADGMDLIPENTEHAVCYRQYQRRTLTGMGWK
jgi:hypothetical protein